MKKLLLLMVSFLISIHSMHINAQESKTAAYVKGSAKIVGGSILTLVGAFSFLTSGVVLAAQNLAKNDWQKYLKTITNQKTRQEAMSRGPDTSIKQFSNAKNVAFFGGFLFSVPGIALIVNGSKQIHRARTEN